ncbi:MAG: asparagine synthase (glutamine-hydrolyzing) [Acidobacteriota bacterium]|nr:asparagine synthase (glutamine-hydrolyzing) [Acidobacteriota bacterium]
MCGITGLFGGPIDTDLLRRMTRVIEHRGPDDRQTAMLGLAGLGATRLSLLDLEGGAQPMFSDDGKRLLAFNGEIYNHNELRARLMREGDHFKGRSDTEVVLRGLVRHGPSFLAEMEGMFALAFTDGRTLTLARDRFGMKPLFFYISADQRRLAFGSEIKTILQDRTVPRRLNLHTLADHAVFGFPTAANTYLEGITQLLPGQVMHVSLDPEERIVCRFDRIPAARVEPPASEEEATERVLELLRRSVEQQMIADHPVGVFLSGGVDSTLAAALMPESAPRLTFVISDRDDLEDLHAAGRVAAVLGTQHQAIRLDHHDLLARLPQAIAANESLTGPTLAFLAAPLIRPSVKAVLCGDGADELFQGYQIHLAPDKLIDRYRKAKTRLAALPQKITAPTFEALQALIDDDPAHRPAFDRLLKGPQLAGAHLWPWDRGSMAAGLEVRLPYLDTELGALTDVLPPAWLCDGGVSKRILRRLLFRVLPEELAVEIAERKKLAAPSALRRSRGMLPKASKRFLPPNHLEDHPLRPFFAHESQLIYADLFAYLFLAGDGTVPTGFTLEHCYGDAYDRLKEALAPIAAAVSP